MKGVEEIKDRIRDQIDELEVTLNCRRIIGIASEKRLDNSIISAELGTLKWVLDMLDTLEENN